MDDESLLFITFDKNELKKLITKAKTEEIVVTVEAIFYQSSTPIKAIPIENYVKSVDSADATQAGVRNELVPQKVQEDGSLPDAIIDLQLSESSNFDSIQLKITNTKSKEALFYKLIPQEYGLRFKVTDSLFFIRRQITEDSTNSNIENVNFGPAPGVTFGAVLVDRDNDFLRILEPGLGINISYLSWNDNALVNNDFQIGVGLQASFFSNLVQFTYGVNLQAFEQKAYWGVGISFVNIAETLGMTF